MGDNENRGSGVWISQILLVYQSQRSSYFLIRNPTSYFEFIISCLITIPPSIVHTHN